MARKNRIDLEAVITANFKDADADTQAFLRRVLDGFRQMNREAAGLPAILTRAGKEYEKTMTRVQRAVLEQHRHLAASLVEQVRSGAISRRDAERVLQSGATANAARVDAGTATPQQLAQMRVYQQALNALLGDERRLRRETARATMEQAAHVQAMLAVGQMSAEQAQDELRSLRDQIVATKDLRGSRARFRKEESTALAQIESALARIHRAEMQQARVPGGTAGGGPQRSLGINVSRFVQDAGMFGFGGEFDARSFSFGIMSVANNMDMIAVDWKDAWKATEGSANRVTTMLKGAFWGAGGIMLGINAATTALMLWPAITEAMKSDTEKAAAAAREAAKEARRERYERQGQAAMQGFEDGDFSSLDRLRQSRNVVMRQLEPMKREAKRLRAEIDREVLMALQAQIGPGQPAALAHGSLWAERKIAGRTDTEILRANDATAQTIVRVTRLHAELASLSDQMQRVGAVWNDRTKTWESAGLLKGIEEQEQGIKNSLEGSRLNLLHFYEQRKEMAERYELETAANVARIRAQADSENLNLQIAAIRAEERLRLFDLTKQKQDVLSHMAWLQARIGSFATSTSNITLSGAQGAVGLTLGGLGFVAAQRISPRGPQGAAPRGSVFDPNFFDPLTGAQLRGVQEELDATQEATRLAIAREQREAANRAGRGRNRKTPEQWEAEVAEVEARVRTAEIEALEDTSANRIARLREQVRVMEAEHRDKVTDFKGPAPLRGRLEGAFGRIVSAKRTEVDRLIGDETRANAQRLADEAHRTFQASNETARLLLSGQGAMQRERLEMGLRHAQAERDLMHELATEERKVGEQRNEAYITALRNRIPALRKYHNTEREELLRQQRYILEDRQREFARMGEDASSEQAIASAALGAATYGSGGFFAPLRARRGGRRSAEQRVLEAQRTQERRALQREEDDRLRDLERHHEKEKTSDQATFLNERAAIEQAYLARRQAMNDRFRAEDAQKEQQYQEARRDLILDAIEQSLGAGAQAMQAYYQFANQRRKDELIRQGMSEEEATKKSEKEGRARFKLYQALAISEALVSTYRGVAAGFAWGMEHGGPIAAAAVAGSALLVGLGNVALIASQKYGSGEKSSSGRGSGYGVQGGGGGTGIGVGSTSAYRAPDRGPVGFRATATTGLMPRPVAGSGAGAGLAAVQAEVSALRSDLGRYADAIESRPALVTMQTAGEITAQGVRHTAARTR